MCILKDCFMPVVKQGLIMERRTFVFILIVDLFLDWCGYCILVNSGPSADSIDDSMTELEICSFGKVITTTCLQI